MTRRQNLVLVTVDAWRSDFVDEYAGVALTPSLAARADRTVRFDGLYANGPWTSPALLSVFSGESPARHGVWYEWSRPRAGVPAIASLLHDAGFSVPNLCYLNRLDNYANIGWSAADAPEPPHGPDDDLLLPALAAHRGIREPFFLWFHYKFVHLPYWPAERYRRALGVDDGALPARLRDSVCTRFVVPRAEHRLDPEADADPVRRLYAAGVLEMDAWLGRVLDELERSGLAGRTTLVVTSDHGEELLDHGHVGHASTAHHAVLHEEVLRIPLLILDPDVRGPRRVTARLQGLDLYPTLLSLAGVTAPAYPGIDCSALVRDPAAWPGSDAETRTFYFHSARMGCPTPRSLASQFVEGLSDGRTKVVRERYDATRAYAVDLTQDPEERSPVSSEEELARPLERLDRLREALGGRAG